MPVRHIGILLFDGVEELDAVGPWEVLSYWTRNHPEDGWEVCLLSRDGGAVTAAKGMVLGAQHAVVDAPPLDVLIHPGGEGTRPLMVDDEHLAWIRAESDRVGLMTSVCTGSLVYAAAGLLAGRPATTHWALLDALAAVDPSIQLRPADRFVDDGDVVTSAGVSAGIDMALHLVVRLAGRDRAVQVRRGIQYDPHRPSSTSPRTGRRHGSPGSTDDDRAGSRRTGGRGRSCAVIEQAAVRLRGQNPSDACCPQRRRH